jgi:hypothetical protein
MLYFLCAHRSNASAEYNAWRNYLDRWNSKMSTTASLTTWNAREQLNGYVPWKHKNQIKERNYNIMFGLIQYFKIFLHKQ